MANNRLYIQDTETGETFMLAKGFGGEWSVLALCADDLEAWLNDGDRVRDVVASEVGATLLRLVTEDELREAT